MRLTNTSRPRNDELVPARDVDRNDGSAQPELRTRYEQRKMDVIRAVGSIPMGTHIKGTNHRGFGIEHHAIYCTADLVFLHLFTTFNLAAQVENGT